MKIRQRSSPETLNAEAFVALVQEERFVPIDLTTYYSDSFIHLVYLSTSCIHQIDEWTTKSLSESPVPEVGGFLLGRYHQRHPNSWEISIETFVPALDVDYSSPVLLEFGSQVMIEMDKIRDEHPGMANVGWFHTHPGHTPFLSDQDLSSHEGFFLKPYQVAIVLDSLTESFDTGIFSRKTMGKMNNKGDRSQWISWKQLVQHS